MRVRKHVDGLHPGNLVFLVQQRQIPCLRGRIAADINHRRRFYFQNFFHQFWVHAGPWRIGNDNVRFSMMGKEFVITHIYYIAANKEGVINIVQGGIFFGILETGAIALQREFAVPSSIASIVEATLILAALTIAVLRGKQLFSRTRTA